MTDIRRAEIAESVLVAILAVNNWSLEQTFELRKPFRDVGLLDLATVATLSEQEIARRLAAAGYARGDYMNTLMALRVLSMAQVLSDDELERLSRSLDAGEREMVSANLRRIKGVGPAVLRNFWILHDHA